MIIPSFSFFLRAISFYTLVDLVLDCIDFERNEGHDHNQTVLIYFISPIYPANDHHWCSWDEKEVSKTSDGCHWPNYKIQCQKQTSSC